MSEESYKDALKNDGLKNTKHRNSILNILEKNARPETAEQIYLSLQNQGVSINLSSVYRILNTLEGKSLLIKSTITGESKAVYELNRYEHKHHFVCTRCKAILPIDGCPLEEYEKTLKDTMGVDVLGHTLEIFGVCKDCRK